MTSGMSEDGHPKRAAPLFLPENRPTRQLTEAYVGAASAGDHGNGNRRGPVSSRPALW